MSKPTLEQLIHWVGCRAYDKGYNEAVDGKDRLADIEQLEEGLTKELTQLIADAKREHELDIFTGVGYGTGLHSILMSNGPDGLADFVIRRCDELLRERQRQRAKSRGIDL